MPLKALPTIDELKITSDMDTSFEDFHDEVAAMKMEDVELQEVEEGIANDATPEDDNRELVKEQMDPCKSCAVVLCATGVSLLLSLILFAIIWAFYSDAQLPQW